MAELSSGAVRTARGRVDPGSVGAWLVPFALLLYLGLNNGGFDVVERSQAGIIAWWIVLVGTAVGILPAGGGMVAGRAMLAVLAAFALWTALALGWTESAERTFVEVGRVAAYLGFFALALAIQGDGRWRALLGGATAGVGVLVAVAALSRMEPSLFPTQVQGKLLRGVHLEGRLAYPINYSSGLAALTAASLPLLLRSASSGRSLFGRGLAAAAIPVAALTLWWTGSSLSVPLAAGGLVVFVALAPARLPKLLTLAVCAAGGAVAILASHARDAVDSGLTNSLAERQGDQMLVILIGICAVVAACAVVIALADRRIERPGWVPISPAVAGAAVGVVLVAGIAVAVAAGAPGKASDEWEHFKHGKHVNPNHASRSAQIFDVSSSGRYDFWASAVDAYHSEPVVGIGPGTFEFWWARNGSNSIFVRDAHSLYFETMGELGIIGLLVIATFVIGVLAIGVVRLTRAPPELRLGLAAALGGAAVIAVGEMVDWFWELGAIEALFLVLAAVAVAGGAENRSTPAWAPRIAVIAVSIAALVAIAIPLGGYSAVRSSQLDAADGRLADALGEARAAQRLQPYAASPRLQQALVLEREGDFEGAVRAARQASAREVTNWRNWFVLSRLEARAGDATAALHAYRVARSLNPRSPLFDSAGGP